MRYWAGIIAGEPASKSNSSQIVKFGGRFAIIKSKKARAYVKDVAKQVPALAQPLQGRLVLHLKIFYATERPDLDESLIMDALQGRIYTNDRQIREKHITHAVDRENPRAVVLIEEREAA